MFLDKRRLGQYGIFIVFMSNKITTGLLSRAYDNIPKSQSCKLGSEVC